MNAQDESELFPGFVACIKEVGEDGIARRREPLSVRNPALWEGYLAFMDAPAQEPPPGFERDCSTPR